ncbi:MAG: FAD-binding oxidoreductase, partial [Gemmatimonadaceae bacterium]
MTNVLEPTTVQTLRDRIQGEVLLPTDPGYEEARAVWNKRFDPRPGAVVRCRSTDDVVAALGFARDHRLPLSVKSGGHSYAGHAVA